MGHTSAHAPGPIYIPVNSSVRLVKILTDEFTLLKKVMQQTILASH